MSVSASELARLLPPGSRLEVLPDPRRRRPDAPPPDGLLVPELGRYATSAALVADAEPRLGPETALLVAATGRAARGRLADLRAELVARGYAVLEHRALVPGPVPGWAVASAPLGLARFGAVPYLLARRPQARPGLSVSVVIPCHDEEGNVAACVGRVPALGATTEILVCDDGSRDGTRAVAVGLADVDPRVRVLAADVNQGKAQAVRAGFAAARGDVVVILDADMTVPPEELPRFVAPLAAGTADLVNGTRFRRPMAPGAMPAANRLGNRAFAGLVAAALAQPLTDTLCGTKALLRQEYLRMPLGRGERWGDFDLLFGAGGLRHRIVEVDVGYGARQAGASKMRPTRETLRFLAACLAGWRRIRGPLDGAPAPPAALPPGWRELRAR